MGANYTQLMTEGVDSRTFTYTRSNGHGGSMSRTTTVNRIDGSCRSIITQTDGTGRVYSDVITGCGCDNTADYNRGGGGGGHCNSGYGGDGMGMYSNNCSNACYSVVPTPVFAPAPAAPTEAPAAAPAGQPMMMPPAPMMAPVPMMMGTVPVYSYNTGMPIMPTATACGYAQGYGFYSGLNARYGYGNTYNTPYYSTYPSGFSGYPTVGRGW